MHLLRRRTPIRAESDARFDDVLALAWFDGHERERAVRAATLGPGTSALVVIRCTDWVPQVRRAALERLEDVPAPRLLELLPLVDALARRERADELIARVDGLLDERTLRVALSSVAQPATVAIWKRLEARGLVTPVDVAGPLSTTAIPQLLQIAATHLGDLDDDHRRTTAQWILRVSGGMSTRRALGALVELDGDAPIVQAALHQYAGRRSIARDLARLRGFDLRSLYLRIGADDALARTARLGLLELCDPSDLATFRSLLDHPHRAVRERALRALARAAPAEGRAEALRALVEGADGRIARAAANVLRTPPPSPVEITGLRRVVLDESRPAGARTRALALLRASRWDALGTTMTVLAGELEPSLHAAASRELDLWLRRWGTIVGRAPEPIRDELRALIPAVDSGRGRELEFILRT